MKCLDVFFYSACPQELKPEGIPESWPWKCLEKDNSDPVQLGAIRMSLDQYNDYRQQHEAEYNEWYIPYCAAQEQAEKDELERQEWERYNYLKSKYGG